MVKRHWPALARRVIFETLEPRQLLSLTHLYTFNDGTPLDSVGGATGALANGAAVANGRLQLQNAGVTSGQTTLVQYAALPSNLLPASGSATIEVWYNTDSATPNWMRVFDFGNGTGSYLFYTPKSSTPDARTSFKASGGTAINATTVSGTVANQGYENMAAIVVDSAAGTLSLYLNGTLAMSTAAPGIDIGTVADTLNYLGRSQYSADAGFSGSIDELRIYNEARTADQVASDNAGGPAPFTVSSTLPKQVEKLDRGVVALPRSGGGIYVSWRLLGTDPAGIAFNLYRSANNGSFVKVNASPITTTTDYSDASANTGVSNRYYVKPVIGGVEQAASEIFTFAAGTTAPYLSVPLQIPAGGVTPTGEAYTYSANDASVGDVDGDGQYEIILKWDPSNSKDNSQSGYTGNVYIDCYKMSGQLLWRIDLGRNIRAGAHYTQFTVYDLDGDGRAEVAMRTAPGTIDGQGNDVILPGDDPNVDYRNTSGYIITGSEYLTIFNGLTGAAMATTNFYPDRVNISQWGDSYGNRGDRFLNAVAYVDGQRPSLITCRGYYGGQSSSSQVRNEIVAWNYRDGQLTKVWTFKAGKNINNDINSNYIGQGTHSVTVGDIDGDGKDEIVYGAAAIDDDGRPLYSTGLGHGDALHLSDMDPTNPGLEVFQIHEDPGSYGTAGGDFRDADKGKVIYGIPATGDVGRGVAFDVDPRYLGYEAWDASATSMYNTLGVPISARPGDYNFGVWWDADPLRELLDGVKIDKWNWTTQSLNRLVTASTVSGAAFNNGTKSTPCLSGDILGDWREEVIWRKSDNTELQIYSTTTPATSRIYTLMHDVQYREAIAWQNSAYNQPPHPSFYLGNGMSAPPTPNVYLAIPVPVVGGVKVNDGSTQRSRVTSVTLTFNTPVTLAAGAITVTRRGGGAAGMTISNPSGDAKTFVVTFTTELADGIYDLRVVSSLATNEAGRGMAADFGFAFHRLFGDSDGNGKVDVVDLGAFATGYYQSLGQSGYRSYLDYDGNGIMNNADLFQFSKRYGTVYTY